MTTKERVANAAATVATRSWPVILIGLIFFVGGIILCAIFVYGVYEGETPNPKWVTPVLVGVGAMYAGFVTLLAPRREEAEAVVKAEIQGRDGDG